MQSNSTNKVVISAKRPFIQRYIALLFLVVAAGMIYVGLEVATGLSQTPILLMLVPLTIFYGLAMGRLVRQSYKRIGYILTPAVQVVVLAVALSMTVCCAVYALGNDAYYSETNAFWSPVSFGFMIIMMIVGFVVLGRDVISKDPERQ